jgi:argininosuccinate synthase
LVETLNRIAGRHGVGRTDMVENRLVGIKSRGVYECPGGTVLFIAHRDLESITIDRETMHYKELISQKYAELVYYGMWFSHQKKALDKFVDSTQENVTGEVRVKLYKGNCTVVGRRSRYSLYDQKLGGFGMKGYNPRAAEGFINLFGLPLMVQSFIEKRK